MPDLGGEAVSAYPIVLSLEEDRRSRMFRSDRDRARFVASRVQLRRILALYTGYAPEDLQFVRSRPGKPGLAPETSAGIEFSLSHSGDLALYAIAAGRRVGVDVEAIEPLDPVDERISPSWLSPRELRALQSMDPALRTRAFYSAWTHKEAYLKAIGLGFLRSPAEVRARFDPGAASMLAARPLGMRIALRWRIGELVVGPGYAGALAVEGRRWRPRMLRFPEDLPSRGGTVAPTSRAASHG